MTHHTQELKASFYAMPDSPHLTHSQCGYTLVSLQGLDAEITPVKITRLLVNGTAQTYHHWGERAVMVYPAFKQEAQAVDIYYTAAAEAPKPFKPWSEPLVPPVVTYGFTAQATPYVGGY